MAFSFLFVGKDVRLNFNPCFQCLASKLQTQFVPPPSVSPVPPSILQTFLVRVWFSSPLSQSEFVFGRRNKLAQPPPPPLHRGPFTFAGVAESNKLLLVEFVFRSSNNLAQPQFVFGCRNKLLPLPQASQKQTKASICKSLLVLHTKSSALCSRLQGGKLFKTVCVRDPARAKRQAIFELRAATRIKSNPFMFLMCQRTQESGEASFLRALASGRSVHEGTQLVTCTHAMWFCLDQLIGPC